MTGLRRNLEDRVNRLLEVFPVVTLLGARQAGKTPLSRRLRPDWRYVDLENAADHDLVTRDYDFFFREHPRHLII
ncbi:MAG: ATP-binding protein, partial [Acidobacteria bacterium]|nr:ATP-binding protein [Acidobacteriota bacterium]